MWLVYTYIWFPFMVLPVYAALERIPGSLLEASADLGGRGWTTTRRVVLPLAVPGIAAGSIFTFSLTLGDYIAPSLVGGPSSQLIGNVIFSNVGVANNIPFAAAFAIVPLAIMAVFLWAMKRLGAFQNL
jgi:putative spermidine/putrescine transport system permease protein